MGGSGDSSVGPRNQQEHSAQDSATLALLPGFTAVLDTCWATAVPNHHSSHEINLSMLSLLCHWLWGHIPSRESMQLTLGDWVLPGQPVLERGYT